MRTFPLLPLNPEWEPNPQKAAVLAVGAWGGHPAVLVQPYGHGGTLEGGRLTPDQLEAFARECLAVAAAARASGASAGDPSRGASGAGASG